MRVKWLLMLVMMCGFLGVLGVHAQDREQTRPYERFAAGGRADNLVYYTPALPDYPRLVRIINESITVFDTMTPTPWRSQIVVVFMGASIPDLSIIGRMTDPSSAYVTRLEPQTLFPDGEVCFLRVFDGWEIDDDIESGVAKQLFYCLLMAIGAAALEDFSVGSNSWWLGASAEWAASRVYPTQFPKPYHALFDHRRNVTTNRLENYYFWEFLASPDGYGSTHNIIEQLGLIRYSGLFPVDYGYTPTDLLHNWAKALISYRLPTPPPLNLGDIELTAGKGGSLTTFIQPLSADYRTLVDFEVEPGNIAFIKASGLSGGNYGVSIRLGGVFKRLVDDLPFEFCPNKPYDMLVISRGIGDKGSRPPLTIEWGQVESINPCEPREDELTDSDMSCVVGHWQVTAFPIFDVLDDLDLSGFTFTFNANNTWSGTYNIIAVDDGNTLTVNLPLSGAYGITESMTVDDDTIYNVASFTGGADPGGSVSFITSDGDFTDLTKQYYDSGDYSDFGPGTSLTCNNTTMSWETAVGAGMLILTRLP